MGEDIVEKLPATFDVELKSGKSGKESAKELPLDEEAVP